MVTTSMWNEQTGACLRNFDEKESLDSVNGARALRGQIEQIIDQMERFVLTGLMKPGTQLPSVRSLSMELSINPNTIQNAYSELDARGVI